MEPPDTNLRPELGLFDATATGLAAILGAGIFAVIVPAAAIAGPSLLVSLVLAAFVAFCNATSSAQLATVYPRSGGTYEFGRRTLGDWWGYVAGWMFLTANTVGPGVIALAFGGYLNATWTVIPARAASISAVLAMTAINAFGIRRSVRLTDIIVILSVVSLLSVVVLGLPGSHVANFTVFAPNGANGVLRATALLFFAYTGYGRIATLVEEVRNPKRTIIRATVLALGGALLLYLLVAGTAIAVLGAARIAQSTSPLRDVLIAASSGPGLAIVAFGALLTTFNEGLSDLLGVSRVAFAMGRGGDLPKQLARLGVEQNPWRSVVLVGVVATIVAGLAPFASAVAVSSFGTLLYYAVTNLSALQLKAKQRAVPAGYAVVGLISCVALAFALAPQEIGVGLAILLGGIAYRAARIAIMKRKQQTISQYSHLRMRFFS